MFASTRRVLGPALRRLQANGLASGLVRLSSRLLINDQEPAIVFSPHQDDETLGCGGTIALKCARGTPVEVVFLTDGQKSPFALGPEALGRVRRREAYEALSILGVASERVHFLDKPDGGLRTLGSAERRDLLARIVGLLRSLQPSEVYVPHRNDRHYYGDHEATYELVHEALALAGLKIKLLQYPVWIFWQAPLLIDLKPEELLGAHRLAISAVRTQKIEAIKIYQSQVFPDGFLERFFTDYELFFV